MPTRVLGLKPLYVFSSNHHEPMTACLHLLCLVQKINAKGTFLVARALMRAAKGADATFIHAGTAASCRVDNFRAVDMISYWKREQERD
jgi:hypothetical protein